jgi:hypothetical protein
MEVLFQRKRYELSQLRIAETLPPCKEFGAGSSMPLIYCRLAQYRSGLGKSGRT